MGVAALASAGLGLAAGGVSAAIQSGAFSDGPDQPDPGDAARASRRRSRRRRRGAQDRASTVLTEGAGQGGQISRKSLLGE